MLRINEMEGVIKEGKGGIRDKNLCVKFNLADSKSVIVPLETRREK